MTRVGLDFVTILNRIFKLNRIFIFFLLRHIRRESLQVQVLWVLFNLDFGLGLRL